MKDRNRELLKLIGLVALCSLSWVLLKLGIGLAAVAINRPTALVLVLLFPVPLYFGIRLLHRMIKAPNYHPDSLGFRRSVRFFGLGLAVGGGVQLACSAAYFAVHPAADSITLTRLIAALLTSILNNLSVACGEELLFRGFLFLAVLRIAGSMRMAALASSAFFCAVHIGSYGSLPWSDLWVLDVLMIGVCLCYAFSLSGSLLLPIGIHVSWNVANDLRPLFLPDVGPSLFTMDQLEIVVVTVLGVALLMGRRFQSPRRLVEAGGYVVPGVESPRVACSND